MMFRSAWASRAPRAPGTLALGLIRLRRREAFLSCWSVRHHGTPTRIGLILCGGDRAPPGGSFDVAVHLGVKFLIDLTLTQPCSLPHRCGWATKRSNIIYLPLFCRKFDFSFRV